MYTQAARMLGNVDNYVQGVGRNTYGYLGDRAYDILGEYGGNRVRDGINLIGNVVHSPYSAYTDDVSGRSALFATRALQAGGITAAGLGLIDATHRFQNMFGQPADYQ